MGNIPTDILDIAEVLYDKILNEYGCSPQNVVLDGAIGFNVRGRKAGLVEDMRDGTANVQYYAPDCQPSLPVFSERIFKF
jgi:hypothetical protein